MSGSVAEASECLPARVYALTGALFVAAHEGNIRVFGTGRNPAGRRGHHEPAAKRVGQVERRAGVRQRPHVVVATVLGDAIRRKEEYGVLARHALLERL